MAQTYSTQHIRQRQIDFTQVPVGKYSFCGAAFTTVFALMNMVSLAIQLPFVGALRTPTETMLKFRPIDFDDLKKQLSGNMFIQHRSSLIIYTILKPIWKRFPTTITHRELCDRLGRLKTKQSCQKKTNLLLDEEFV